MKRQKKFKLSVLLEYAFLILILIITIFPVFYVVASSFKTNMELMSHPEHILPSKPTLDNYITAWNSDQLQIGRMLWNSIWFTTLSVIITLLNSAICGYVFSRGEFKLKKPLFVIFSSLMFISLGGISIYPLFEILTLVHLNKSLMGLVVCSCFGIPVVNMYLVRGFVNALPKEMDEAAEMDGCTFTGVFFRIILPLLKPVMATIGILSFQSTWNSYLMPAIFTMTKPKQQTLIVGVMALKQSGNGASYWNLMFAGTVIAMFPVLIAYVFGSKYFTDGMISGAVKG